MADNRENTESNLSGSGDDGDITPRSTTPRPLPSLNFGLFSLPQRSDRPLNFNAMTSPTSTFRFGNTTGQDRGLGHAVGGGPVEAGDTADPRGFIQGLGLVCSIVRGTMGGRRGTTNSELDGLRLPSIQHSSTVASVAAVDQEASADPVGSADPPPACSQLSQLVDGQNSDVPAQAPPNHSRPVGVGPMRRLTEATVRFSERLCNNTNNNSNNNNNNSNNNSNNNDDSNNDDNNNNSNAINNNININNNNNNSSNNNDNTRSSINNNSNNNTNTNNNRRNNHNSSGSTSNSNGEWHIRARSSTRPNRLQQRMRRLTFRSARRPTLMSHNVGRFEEVPSPITDEQRRNLRDRFMRIGFYQRLHSGDRCNEHAPPLVMVPRRGNSVSDLSQCSSSDEEPELDERARHLREWTVG